jgi:hypothetical protein
MVQLPSSTGAAVAGGCGGAALVVAADSNPTTNARRATAEVTAARRAKIRILEATEADEPSGQRTFFHGSSVTDRAEPALQWRVRLENTVPPTGNDLRLSVVTIAAWALLALAGCGKEDANSAGNGPGDADGFGGRADPSNEPAARDADDPAHDPASADRKAEPPGQ